MALDLQRRTSWDADLQEYLDRVRGDDMACGFFAAGAVSAVTGVDLVKHFAGRLDWVRDNMEAALDEVMEPRLVSFARSGDVVTKDGNVGVCFGGTSMFMALWEGQTGLAEIPTLDCDKAWTVG